jgi:enolase-phosphatase E1
VSINDSDTVMTSAPTNTWANTRAILLDIEGTVTPISFVHDILFPFARDHVREFLVQHSADAAVKTDIAALVQEHKLDIEKGEQPPQVVAESIDSLVAYVNWLIDLDRKSSALKSLQGKIWEQGYDQGNLKAPLFDDVVPNLCRLRAQKIKIAIFSSGSVLAQKLLFGHTETGDHTGLIDDYFDTGVGRKVDPESYRTIAERLKLSPQNTMFVSDVVNELGAASKAGMMSLLCVRPANPPQIQSKRFREIKTFSEILPF